jgi:hypothetical protein
MWPWEHLALGYLLYSACSRWLWGRPPSATGTVVVAFASQLPDLVDKPLAWVLFVLPGGRSLGHSLLVGLPLIGVAFAIGWALDSCRGSVAFAVGHLSHLLGDVIYPLVVRGDLRLGFLLWPVVPVEDGPDSTLPHVSELVAVFVEFLATPRGTLYLVADLLLLVAALAVWLLDGMPVLRGLFGTAAPE